MPVSNHILAQFRPKACTEPAPTNPKASSKVTATCKEGRDS